MAAFNRVILVGNLTRDPEHRMLPSGQGLCRLGLATNRQFKSRQTGAMVQEVCYIDVDVWGPQADSCRQYLQKGRSVLVEGRLKLDSWEDQTTGQKRSKHLIVAERVVFLSNGVSAENSFGSAMEDSSEEMQLNPNNPVERDLLEQLEKAKTRVKATSTAKTSSTENVVSTGEIDFQDQPPFEDNLPF